MARTELLPGVWDDFDRFIDHMERFDVPDPADRIEQILRAIEILTFSPLIGRPIASGRANW